MARILVFTDNDTWRGGDVRHLRDCCNAWCASGHEVQAAYPKATPREEEQVGQFDARVQWVPLPIKTELYYRARLPHGIWRRPAYLVFLVRRVFLLLWQTAWFVSWLMTLRPDVLYTTNGGWPGADAPRALAIAGRLARVPVVIFAWHSLYTPPVWFLRPWDWLVRTAVVRSASVMLTYSAYVQEDFLRRAHIAPALAARFRHVLYGIPDLPALAEQARPAPAAKVKVFFCGSLVAIKGADLAVAIAGRLRDVPCEFHIYGEGDLRAACLAAATGLPQVRFHGFLPGVETRLAEAALLLVPSRQECMPYVILEAMRAGVPVVAARIAGIPEVVEDGVTGLLVTAGDVDGFAAAVRALVADPTRRAAMGRAARQAYLARFQLARMMDEITALFTSPASL